MYQVFKDGRTSIRRTFDTYEAGRQAARKLCRNSTLWVFGRAFTSNPTISFHGYSVRKVA